MFVGIIPGRFYVLPVVVIRFCTEVSLLLTTSKEYTNNFYHDTINSQLVSS